MLKRNAAVIAIVALVLGVGAYAWAQGSPSRPQVGAHVTAQQGQDGTGRANGRAAGRALGVLRRTVHGELVVRTKNGFQQVVYNRGVVKSHSDTSITVTRPDTNED